MCGWMLQMGRSTVSQMATKSWISRWRPKIWWFHSPSPTVCHQDIKYNLHPSFDEEDEGRDQTRIPCVFGIVSESNPLWIHKSNEQFEMLWCCDCQVEDSCQEIEFMSTRVRYSKALDGTDYIPGCIGWALSCWGWSAFCSFCIYNWNFLEWFRCTRGLNNIQDSDYQNVIIQMLCTASSSDGCKLVEIVHVSVIITVLL